MTYATPYMMSDQPPPRVPPKKIPDPNPPCTDCPHSAMDHNGDGYGSDKQGPFDWFLCPVEGCGCRVKGYLHVKQPMHPTMASTGALYDL